MEGGKYQLREETWHRKYKATAIKTIYICDGTRRGQDYVTICICAIIANYVERNRRRV